ncbi:triple tyrosine motif-containing protein [Ekhidna sp.]|uniref:triple tyrosine motif-containing protein n=1 Tax=Ekhidna sp. TaxID=2608089 RepID=UPI003CCBA3B6
MRLINLLFFTFLNVISSYAQEPNNPDLQLLSLPLITTYTPSDYDGGIQNWDIDQDTSGYVYIANNYGLLEFDGASWNNYPIIGATKTRSVLIEQSTNKIYVGGQKQLGFFERTQTGLRYHNLVTQIPDSVTKDEVWDIVEFNNKVYANIDGTIAELTKDLIKPIPGTQLAEFLTILDTSLFVGSTNGLFRLVNDSFKLLKNSEGYNYRGIASSHKMHLLFTYDGEILSYDNNTLTLLKPRFDQFLRESKINKVLKLRNGNIVIGTQNNGLLIVNENLDALLHLTKNKGLNHRTVIALYEDNFNNLWVGLNNGVCVVELGSPFSLINEDIGLEGTGYAATFVGGRNFLGTSSGLFESSGTIAKVDESAGYKLISGSNGLVNNVQAIDNNIILSHHEGAFRLNSDGFIPFFQGTGVWAFTKLAEDKLIGGTYEGFHLFDKRGNIITEKKALTNLNESSRVFEFINDSTLWMTHGYKGVFKIHLKSDTIFQIEHYGEDEGFPSDILISAYKIDDELIFTAETGIYRYNKETDLFEPHPFLNKWFENRHVSKIKQINNNQIFYIAGGQLGVLNKQAIGVYEAEEQPFKKINEFISDDLENINLASNGDLLIGAKEGFIRYNPRHNISIKEAFNTYLKKVSITDESDETSIISGPFFSSSQINQPKRIRFEYSAPYFDGINKVRYAYRLHPYDENWSEWTEVNWKEYTNLPADNYTFEVKSLNIYGTESSISEYTFTIEPEWYETNIAYAAYASIIIFIFSSVLLVRERKHKVEKHYINKSKEEVIRSKEREISEFSEKTNQQIQALKNESLKKEIDHKNSQLASVTMHLLSKNEFVMSLQKKLKDALNDKDNKDSLNKIVKSIDRNIDEDEAWETFAHHFDQVHGNFLHKIKEEVNLTPQETKLCAYLKMNMSTKDIANLMNITIRGVELARYRLRKKLGITRETNLVAYLDNF